MSIVQIDYLVDLNRLPLGGTYENPTGIYHPDVRVYRDHHPISSEPQGGDIAVAVPHESQVVITMEDSMGRPNVRMAPVRFLAGRWNHSIVTVEQMENAETKPIDEPQFDVSHSEYYSLSYEPGSPAWEEDNDPTFTRFMRGVMIGNPTNVESNANIGPYIAFRTQSLTGSLWYGLSFSVVMDNVDFGYYWFDPTIQIG